MRGVNMTMLLKIDERYITILWGVEYPPIVDSSMR